MKRIASVLLVLILSTTFLYNVVGIHLLLSLEKEQIWVSEMQKISDSEFKIIKLNASIYSFVEDSELEYVNENITIKGKVFHIFKKQIKDNIISLYYLPNKHQSSTDVVLKKMVDNDLFENSALSKKPLEKVFKIFLKDYVDLSPTSFCFCVSTNKQSINLDKHPEQNLLSGYFSMIHPPPKFV